MSYLQTTRLYLRVHGRVQGVGFRWFVRRAATDLDLSGWVRNEVDGTVTVEAEGKRDAAERLLERVQAGSPGSRIDRVETRWAHPSGMTGPFRIR